jgi:DNA-binding FadR family transcriptional regulator
MFTASETITRNIHGQIADRIGSSIVRGDVIPGELLPSEMRICELWTVSRTVVREAIRTLTGKRLVQSRAKSGTRVRPPEEWNWLDQDVLRWQMETSDVDSYVAKLFQLRCAVEPAAAALAASSAGEADVARIRAGYEGMVAAQNDADFVSADIVFHESIYFATRNEFFWPIAQMLKHTLRKNFTITSGGNHRPRAFVEHRAVLDAIAAHDGDAARAAAVVLLAHSIGDVVRIRDSATNADPAPLRGPRARPDARQEPLAIGAADESSD